MKFGVALPTCREGLFYPFGFATTESMIKITKEAERLGFDFVSGNDHYTTQRYLKTAPEVNPNFFEPLMTFSYLAAITERIKFNTGVLVIPIRNIIVLAKQIATLDVMSEGRLILGVGIGAYREEFERAGGSGNRGKILEEQVRALIELLTKPVASFDGKYVKFTDVEMFPKPIQKPFPIWFSKKSPEVLRRVGEFGEGWEPATLAPEQIDQGRKVINEYAIKAGRDPSKLAIAPECSLYIAEDRERARQGFLKGAKLLIDHIKTIDVDYLKKPKAKTNLDMEKWRLVGTPDDIISKIEEYEEVGVTHIWFDVLGTKVDEIIRQFELFSNEVMPSF